jgi:hypothetical protein
MRLSTKVRARLLCSGLPLALVLLAACSADTGEAAPNVTVFEGARLITGDGSDPIENGVIVVENDRITQVGAAGAVTAPDGATRVDLAGKTVIPALINTHMHPATTRAGLIRDLEHDAYWGVGAVMSLGSDSSSHSLAIRSEVLPNAARFRTAWRGITRPEKGRTTVPFWVNTEEEARRGVQQIAAHQADIVKIWVDDRNGQYEKMTPAAVRGRHRRGAQEQPQGHRAHLRARGCEGSAARRLDAFAHSVRDKDIDDEFVALVKEHPNVVLVPNLPGPGRRGRSELARRDRSRRRGRRDAGPGDRSAAGPAGLRDPGAQPRAPEPGGDADRVRDRRGQPVGRAHRARGHGAGRDDARAGHRGRDAQFGRAHGAHRHGHARGR